MWSTAEKARTLSLVMFFHELLHMDTAVLVNQQRLT